MGPVPHMNATAAAILRFLAQPAVVARRYTPRQARGDALAGLTVAVVAVPQAMAYALVAGVAPIYGLVTLVVQSLLGALFNANPYLSVGPINTQSLLVAATVTRLMTTVDPHDTEPEALYLQLVVALTLIKGAMQVGFALLRMGGLVKYVSQSVIVGFTAGAGVLIAAGQLHNFLGVEALRAEGDWPGLIGVVQRLWPNVSQLSATSIAVGCGALGILVGARAVSRLLPGALLAVVAGGLAVWVAGWSSADLPLVQPLPARGELVNVLALPAFSLDQLESLLPGALALAMLGLMEAYAIGTSIAARTGQRIGPNRELASQGLVNLISAFFSCMPGSGSFSRSALNYHAGAKTLYSGVFNAVFVLLIVLMFAPAARFVPMAALAAVLFVIAWQLIDFRFIGRVWRTSRADAAVCFVTFAATLITPLEYAIFIGVALNIAIYLRQSSRLHVNELVQSHGGPFTERPVADRSGRRAIVFLSLEGDLFFGVADELQDALNRAASSGVRVVILRLKRTHSVDATVLSVLERFAQVMHERQGHVLLCGVRPGLSDAMRRFGLVSQIGEENLFEVRYGVFASAKAAVRRARVLVGHSIDADALMADEQRAEEDGAWSYQI